MTLECRNVYGVSDRSSPSRFRTTRKRADSFGMRSNAGRFGPRVVARCRSVRASFGEIGSERCSGSRVPALVRAPDRVRRARPCIPRRSSRQARRRRTACERCLALSSRVPVDGQDLRSARRSRHPRGSIRRTMSRITASGNSSCRAAVAAAFLLQRLEAILPRREIGDALVAFCRHRRLRCRPRVSIGPPARCGTRHSGPA